MAKIFYTNGTGSQQTLSGADTNKIKVFSNKDSVVSGDNEVSATLAVEGADLLSVDFTTETDSTWTYTPDVIAYSDTTHTTPLQSVFYKRFESGMIVYAGKVIIPSSFENGIITFPSFNQEDIIYAKSTFVSSTSATDKVFCHVEPATGELAFAYWATATTSASSNTFFIKFCLKNGLD